MDGGDWPAITPTSPPANWQPRNADGSWAETLIERFSCHHRWAWSGPHACLVGVRAAFCSGVLTSRTQFPACCLHPCDHCPPPACSFSAGFWARMGGMRLRGTAWADNAEALQFATTGQHVAPPGASYLDNTMCVQHS